MAKLLEHWWASQEEPQKAETMALYEYLDARSECLTADLSDLLTVFQRVEKRVIVGDWAEWSALPMVDSSVSLMVATKVVTIVSQRDEMLV